jgi:hypothetical protein
MDTDMDVDTDIEMGKDTDMEMDPDTQQGYWNFVKVCAIRIV